MKCQLWWLYAKRSAYYPFHPPPDNSGVSEKQTRRGSNGEVGEGVRAYQCFVCFQKVTTNGFPCWSTLPTSVSANALSTESEIENHNGLEKSEIERLKKMNLWLDFQGLPILEFQVLQFLTLIIQKGLGKNWAAFPLIFFRNGSIDSRLKFALLWMHKNWWRTSVDPQNGTMEICASTKSYDITIGQFCGSTLWDHQSLWIHNFASSGFVHSHFGRNHRWWS